MLQKLDSEIRECYRHAVECSRSADESRDSLTKQEFLEMARRWLSLAHSYEFAEQLSDFTELSRKQQVGTGPIPRRYPEYRPHDTLDLPPV